MKGRKVVNEQRTDGGRGPRWIYGVNPVGRRLEVNPASVLELCVAGRSGHRVDSIEEAARQHGISVRNADATTLARLTGSTAHQGVAALARPVPCVELSALFGEPKRPILIVDQVTDPQNLGALVRSAVASGMGGVVIPKHGAAGITPVVEKASAGAVNDILLCQVVNVAQAIREAGAAGYWSLALAPGAEKSLFDLELPGPMVLVVGGESGLRPLVERVCDLRASIPMRGPVESLNASVAGALAMYEIMRRAGC